MEKTLGNGRYDKKVVNGLESHDDLIQGPFDLKEVTYI